MQRDNIEGNANYRGRSLAKFAEGFPKPKGDDSVKKMIVCLILLLTIVLVSLTAFAAPAPAQESKQLVDKYTEIHNKLESGISYGDFRLLRQDLYAMTKRYLDKYPDGLFNSDFEHLSKIYSDIDETWQFKAVQGVHFLPRTKEQVGSGKTTNEHFLHYLSLRVYYPEMMATCLESKEYGYFINSVVDNLLMYANNKTRELSNKIAAVPLK